MLDTSKGAALLLNEAGNIDRARTTDGTVYYIESTLAVDAAANAEAAAEKAYRAANLATVGENERINSENIRNKSEEERNGRFDDAIRESEAATAAANSAANSALTAADDASWYIKGTTLVMGASARVVGDCIELGGA